MVWPLYGAVHRSNIYDKPDQFLPERWLNISEADEVCFSVEDDVIFSSRSRVRAGQHAHALRSWFAAVSRYELGQCRALFSSSPTSHNRSLFFSVSRTQFVPICAVFVVSPSWQADLAGGQHDPDLHRGALQSAVHTTTACHQCWQAGLRAHDHSNSDFDDCN